MSSIKSLINEGLDTDFESRPLRSLYILVGLNNNAIDFLSYQPTFSRSLKSDTKQQPHRLVPSDNSEQKVEIWWEDHSFYCQVATNNSVGTKSGEIVNHISGEHILFYVQGDHINITKSKLDENSRIKANILMQDDIYVNPLPIMQQHKHKVLEKEVVNWKNKRVFSVKTTSLAQYPDAPSVIYLAARKNFQLLIDPHSSIAWQLSYLKDEEKIILWETSLLEINLGIPSHIQSWFSAT